MKIHKGIILLGLGLSLGVWKAVEYRQYYEMSSQNSWLEMNKHQKRLKSLQKDQNFLEDHRLDMESSSFKKFLCPENRLITGKFIEEVGKTFIALQYTFEPQRTIAQETGFTYRTTKIVIDVATLLDTEIYNFIEKLLKDFPGVLHLSEVNLVLNTENPPPFMKGKLVFEWYAMGMEK